MTNITQLLKAANRGDQQAAADLLPLVYDELRKLAAAKLAHEKANQTLNSTALVHEAYLRLVGDQQFDGRGHFFAAAGEAMRRILVDSARRKQTRKHGRPINDIQAEPVAEQTDPLELLAIDEALTRLELVSERRAKLVKLRFFVGLTLPEIATILDVSQSTIEADWTYAKAWLRRELEK
jgi:RNA polymerase sigma factor (TIGR02999 family)